jgi:CheY-like chemotaxis protein
MLILSRMLASNEDRSLTDQQVEFARTIHAAGNELLELINDILDLSKVEAGRMELELSSVPLSDIAEDAERAFRQVAEQKGLEFKVELDAAAAPSIMSDRQRIGQVLKNLLSNAFKFTDSGGVTLAIAEASRAVTFERESLGVAETVLCLSVADTGVGIPEDKLDAIFEAFQQADGTTSRKYGGTGLGLSISREIALLLGGEIHVESEVGSGSRFSLFVPLAERVVETVAADSGEAAAATAPAALLQEPVSDDRSELEPDDRVMIVIGSLPERAERLREAARRHGAKVVVGPQPAAGLGLVREHRPQAVLIAGPPSWVEAVLSQLKKHPDTRHVPVVVVADPAVRLSALRAGAAAFVDEPIAEDRLDEALAQIEQAFATELQRVVLVDQTGELDDQAAALLRATAERELKRVSTSDAKTVLRERPCDLSVVVVGEHPTEALALLRDISADPSIRERPVVAFVQHELPKSDRARLDALAKSAAMAVVDSPERLVDRAALYLHRVEANLPASARRMLDQLRSGDGSLRGKKVLVIDDDIRNVFALTSTLEQRGMKVVFAENGREGVERLQQHPNTDLVLLDIMMPEMDGYETARAIRAMPRFEHLPIISLTAKAMKGDREKAIEAGASDYITKPVDVDTLVSMMRVWLGA